MKNQTFAAYWHIPTGAIHILDLALFSNQQMSNQDGATSLVCKYTSQDGEPELAVIWSGSGDEPGVTYVPLSEKENAEIMEAYTKCPMSIPAIRWIDIKEAVGQFGEYRFAMRTIDPEHVLATVEFIEPVKS
jgi:hypothetical protein